MSITVRDIMTALDAEVLAGSDKMDAVVSAVGAGDMMSDLLAFCKPGMIVLTGYTQPQVIRTAMVTDLLGLVVVRGKNITPETIAYARENNVLLLRTKCYMYSSCGKLYRMGLMGIDV